MVTIGVRWVDTTGGPPREDDVFATRNKRTGELSSLYHVQAIAGGPRHYKITAVKLDPRSWGGDLDWELEWNSRD